MAAITIAGNLERRHASLVIPWLVGQVRSSSEIDSKAWSERLSDEQRKRFSYFRQAAINALVNFGPDGEAALLELLSNYFRNTPVWADVKLAAPEFFERHKQ